ncbi:hypothetical protein GGX14DRAFT_607515 [Mycena pura]|uniref:NACHT domain-containing protein n=1 Tax=Mycena pura TaxID=153505 RepID=A0AAD6ULJ7_9AGAR|nr:hypothetical protein GGX14DRAFT_607515 [Mycena pura]
MKDLAKGRSLVFSGTILPCIPYSTCGPFSAYFVETFKPLLVTYGCLVFSAAASSRLRERSCCSLSASLKRREAAEAMFETEVMALLAPVKLRLAEIARESVLAHDRDAVSDLPPAPQLLYGRERELSALARMFAQGRQAHAALLGEAGAGKSTLALALLHRPEIISQFGPRRFFVRGASSDVAGVAVRLSSALGLRLSHTPRDPDPPQAFVLAALSSCPFDSLIVLDDLDDAWASPHTRPALGAFLADLAAIPSVSLLLTLRGAQRPLGPVYTQPYPAPLGPLPLCAARTLFRAISGLSAGSVNDADVPCADDAAPRPLLADVGIAALSRGAISVEPTLGPDDALLDALLHHAECLPQAVVLLAQRAQYEPLPFLLARLEEGDV